MALADPFAILGLPRRYDVAAEEIERRYLERITEMHPDLLAAQALGGLGDDGLDSEQRSSELNEARQILEDPERRAIALWRLLGGFEDKSLSSEFLMEMMNVREEMESAKTPEDRARWDTWTRQRRAAHQQRVGELFAAIEAGGSRDALLKQIKLDLNAWRYIERMAEQLG